MNFTREEVRLINYLITVDEENPRFGRRFPKADLYTFTGIFKKISKHKETTLNEFKKEIEDFKEKCDINFDTVEKAALIKIADSMSFSVVDGVVVETLLEKLNK